MTETTPRLRRRVRIDERRDEVLKVRLAAAELEALKVTAAEHGLTTAGWVASTAVAVARNQLAPLPASTADVLRELVEARTQLRRYATLLNQAVAKLNALGERDESLAVIAGRCETAMDAIGGAVERIGRRGQMGVRS
ncbi:hypothetical protein [Enterococcus hirae]|uniref:hypothetical protein n=1 Tax=Enterococcus hirae TaxID=1354 RepID=UPI001368C6FD|nr:hypothetical protein [Enterococcus hirae]NAE18029.1 hypothetical protein [Enterococcus hirae]